MIINFFTLNFAATSCYINDSNSDTNLLQQNIFKIKKKKKKRRMAADHSFGVACEPFLKVVKDDLSPFLTTFSDVKLG